MSINGTLYALFGLFLVRTCRNRNTEYITLL